MFTKSDIIKFLRGQMLIQSPSISADADYLALTDEDITLKLRVSLTRVDPTASIDSVPDGSVYPLVLLTMKELYFQLATTESPLFTIGFDNSEVKQSDRFDHYFKLVQETEKQFNDLQTVMGTVTSSPIMLNGRYYTKRNYDNASKPVIRLSADNVYINSVEFSFVPVSFTRFYKWALYVNPAGVSTPIVDIYNEYKVNPQAILLKTSFDMQDNTYRATGLTPNTQYHFSLVLEEPNTLMGVSEIDITTLST